MLRPRLRSKILARLPEADFDRIASQLERVTPPLAEVVAQPDVPPKYVHFPESGVLSSMVVLEDGSTVERVNRRQRGARRPLPSWPTGWPIPTQITVQVVGDFLRVSAAAFKQFLAESPAMTQLLARYALVSIQRGAQNAACIQHHTIEERMCRWLLETAHRKGEDQFGLTQEFLSDMLGVRRQSVNLTARVLQQARLITYHRGELTILDRAGLEEASCECFRVTTETYERTMRLPSH